MQNSFARIVASGLFLAFAPAAGAFAGTSHAMETADAGAPAPASQAARTVRIEAGDQSFSVKQIKVAPGQVVRFVVTNKSSIDHEFVIATADEQKEHQAMMQKMPGMMQDEPNGITVKPGETKEITWRFPRNRVAISRIEFACDIPGHAQMGMVGHFQAL